MRFPSSLTPKFAALVLSAGLAAAGAQVAQAAPIGAYTTKGAWSFVSAPSLHPPKLHNVAPTVTRKLAPGDLLVANFPNVGARGPMTGQGGPLMVDNKLAPVWFAPVSTSLLAANLQQETYSGQPVLVWWEGLVSSSGVTTKGQVMVVDQHYRKVAQLKARAPWVVSLHDAAISGSAIWVTVYRTVKGQNLKPYRGPARAAVLDAGVQEYDLKTGKLLYTWDALNPGHRANLPLSASLQPAPASGSKAWDAYHVNSVQPLANHQILLSMRNTSAAYLINTTTGRIAWSLGGRHSSFKGAPNTRFAWQHDVQMLPGGKVTMFNDNCCSILPNGDLGKPSAPSAGTVLKLNTSAHTVSLVKNYRHRPYRYTAFLGSMQLLPQGNALVGYGSLPYLSEYSPSGRLLLDAVFPGKDQSYRARFSSTWVGTPYFPPSGAARRRGSTTIVYASWNGATQVASWQLMGGTSASSLKPIATKSRSGFETSLTVSAAGDKVFQLIALNAQAQPIGTSARFATS